MRVAIAASGGMDSTALLHCTARIAAQLGVQVHALHVHHGLLPDGDDWLAQVAAQCRRWSRPGARIEFHAHRVQTRPAKGDSIEAWARRVRYAALSAMAQEAGCSLVLLAHHRRDQAETVLLQALRGAGPAGLSAMPRQADRAGLTWVRPWLDQPREAIAAYAQRWQLRYAVDPSNLDLRPARSRLRNTVWPTLLGGFADAESSLAAAARRAQEARAITDEVATTDALRVSDAQGLQVPAWTALGQARRSNVLRHWLGQALGGPVPETLVHRLMLELPDARIGQWPAGQVDLRLHAGCLQPVALRDPVSITARHIDLSRPGVYALDPWPGAIRVESTAQGGVAAASLAHAELRARSGGEQFQSHARGVPRSLKKQFQDQGVPAWSRDVPLVYADGALVFAPGLGTDARALLAAGDPRVRLHWQP